MTQLFLKVEMSFRVRGVNKQNEIISVDKAKLEELERHKEPKDKEWSFVKIHIGLVPVPTSDYKLKGFFLFVVGKLADGKIVLLDMLEVDDVVNISSWERNHAAQIGQQTCEFVYVVEDNMGRMHEWINQALNKRHQSDNDRSCIGWKRTVTTDKEAFKFICDCVGNGNLVFGHVQDRSADYFGKFMALFESARFTGWMCYKTETLESPFQPHIFDAFLMVMHCNF